MKVVVLVVVALLLVALLPEVHSSKTSVFTASVPSAEALKAAATTQAERDPTDMLPWPSERLPIPISLTRCSGVKIIEWRASNRFERSTGPSDSAISELDAACVRARMSFSKFIRDKRMVALSLDGFHQDVCLMPADIRQDGNLARNLNDSRFRFLNRDKEYTSDGRLYTIWGYTDYAHDTMFMWNKVLNEDGSVNRKFLTIFSHEMFHAMSRYSKLYLNYRGAVGPQDENMAHQFTTYLGFIE